MADAPEAPDDDIPGPSADETVDLVNRVRAGDQEALAVLMSRFLPRLRRWASGRMPNALRDVGREGGLQAYLRQSVLNRIRDEFRRARRRPEIVEIDTKQPDGGPSPLEAAIGKAGLEQYEAALSALRPIDREAIIARVELGFTYEEVAAALGKPSANAARMAVERALVRLVNVISEP